MADKQGRKWQITINNPQDKGLDHDAIKLALDDLRSLDYYCVADEIGLETQTPHTHLFIVCRSPVTFARLHFSGLIWRFCHNAITVDSRHSKKIK